MAYTSGSNDDLVGLESEPEYDGGTPGKKKSAAALVARRIKKLKGKAQRTFGGKPERIGGERTEILEQLAEQKEAGLGVKVDLSDFQKASQQVQGVGAKIASLGTSVAVDKMIGENFKAGLPMSFNRHVLLNVGQICSVGADILGMIIPVIGEGAGAPITHAGTTLAMMGQGYNKKQALAAATANTATSVATGAIPVVGTVFSAVGFANDLAALCTPIAKASKLDALEQMRAAQTKCMALVVDIEKAADEAGVDIGKKRAQLDRLLEKQSHYINKYEMEIMKKLEADKDGSKYAKYAEYLTNYGLLNLDDDDTFDKFVDLPTLPEG